MWYPWTHPDSGPLPKNVSHKKGLPYLGPLPLLWWGLFWHSIAYPPLGCCPGMVHRGTTPVSSVNVTFIPKQYLLLGWLGGFLAGTKMVSGRGNCPTLPSLQCPFDSGTAHPHGPLSAGWLQMFCPLSHWHDCSGHELKLRIKANKLGAKALARNEKTTWFALAMSLSCWLGLHLYATNGDPLQTWGCLLPGKR